MAGTYTRYNQPGRHHQNGTSFLNKADTGTISEHLAICDLTQQGWMVSKACSPQCIFDLVAVNDEGQVRLIDVKTKSFRKKNRWTIFRSPSAKQKKLGVEIMVIDPMRHLLNHREKHHDKPKKL
jgi:hypothetical protein